MYGSFPCGRLILVLYARQEYQLHMDALTRVHTFVQEMHTIYLRIFQWKNLDRAEVYTLDTKSRCLISSIYLYFLKEQGVLAYEDMDWMTYR